MHTLRYRRHPLLLQTWNIAILHHRHDATSLAERVAERGSERTPTRVMANLHFRESTRDFAIALGRIFATRHESRPSLRDRLSRMSYLDGPCMSREMDKL